MRAWIWFRRAASPDIDQKLWKTTIVAIVIFLCGVLVGRGLRAPRPVETVATGELGADPTGEHTLAPLTPAVTAPPPIWQAMRSKSLRHYSPKG